MSSSRHIYGYIFAVVLVALGLILVLRKNNTTIQPRVVDQVEHTPTPTANWKHYDDPVLGVSFQYPADWGVFVIDVAEDDVREAPRGYFVSVGPTVDAQGNIFDVMTFQGSDLKVLSFKPDPNLYYTEMMAAPANEPQPYILAKITHWQVGEVDNRRQMKIDVSETPTSKDNDPYWSPIIRRYVFDSMFTKNGKKSLLIANVYYNNECQAKKELCAKYTRDVVLELSDSIVESIKFKI